ARISDQYRTATMGVLRVAFLSALVLEMVATISTAVVAVQIGLRLLYGQMSFAQGFFVLLLAPEFYLPLRMLGTRFHAGMEGVAAADRIFEVLDERPQVRAGSLREGWAVGGPQPLRLEDVDYAYQGGQRPALNGFSLRVEPGETVALVGPSGGGKSTVAQLLLAFLQVDAGQIRIGDTPLAELSPAAWRQQVAWVPQAPYLFYGTVADNIRLGQAAGVERIARAAHQARAAAFIEALPQGYDTIIGERGVRLSGGEAQRIALARAFLKDAPYLILDEATANLDPEIEAQIQDAMAQLSRGRTTLIIAHRLSTVRRADRIVVIDGGRVVESGSHQELMQQDGLYRRLVGAYHREAPGFATAPDAPGALPADAIPASAARDGGPRLVDRADSQSRDPAGRVLARLFRLAAPFGWQMALAALLGFATIASSIGLLATSGYLIARAALQPSIADLQVAIVGVRFFGITRGVARYVERLVAHDVTFRLLARLRVWFYEALEPLAPARLMQYRSGDLYSRIVADIGTLENVYLRVIAPPFVAVLVSVLAGFLVGGFSPWLAVILVVFLILAGGFLPALVMVLGRQPGERLVLARANLHGLLVDSIQGMADLLAFGQEGRQAEQAMEWGRQLAHLQARMGRIGGLHTALTGLLMNLATLAVLAMAISLVVAGGQLDGVYLAMLVLVVVASFEAVVPLPGAFQYLENSLEAARRLFALVDAQPAVADPETPAPAPDRCYLKVEDLHFAYEPGAPPAVDGVSFEVAEGQCVAIVGPSGAGKSTLVQLLLRFWAYDQGRWLWAGLDLGRYCQADLRRRVAVVSQQTHLFNATVRDNLLLAVQPGTTGDELEERMVQAAKQAQIHEFVESLPQGYDTWLGEQGLRFSGGQRQRLAIARALLRDAPILVLDEPTANLDPLTEQQVLDALGALMAGRTTLLITHRLVGLEVADEILVMRQGRIVERGRHYELLERVGLYHRMWQLQGQILVPTQGGRSG
ncbi:MAG: thiol reductant ABC exporter subunit CydC, partial [Anaerolineae bacterium]